ncbi:MAG TPA: [acyl-carrier-protein] S-malonyltransferase [Gammaproteobacteria bacterium]|nr:[acyl-carrier-protein] S-malonyltransferase [Gammaproteobacteria bacterium]
MTHQIAFVFPGQGSQSVGMLNKLAQTHAIVQQTFEEASDALDVDLWALASDGPAEDLNQTFNTQPAMLAAGVAVWRVWRQLHGEPPLMMAGHSLGEYTALVCAGAIAFGDAVALVAERGRLMQEAVPPGEGAMAAILGLDDEQVRTLCAEAVDGDVVEAVNFNSPGQVVIAGSAAAVGRAMELAKAAGAKRAIPLPVSVPSHCALMKPAAVKLQLKLADVAIQAPRITVIQNVSVTSESDAEMIRQRLVEQLFSPVRWVETVQKMQAEGVELLVEAGPGKVLTGLARRIDRKLNAVALFEPQGFEDLLESINE